ncbi:hypothetical protein [Amycolatopsis taiwanensis]|uniref:hypothetical protein n=1 Tax=Amycolatopsis taiwanensis TaxID=342230 RepID=UPI0004815817|nr:hypothetical protein [Amycolatopsis taiwanensis]
MSGRSDDAPGRGRGAGEGAGLAPSTGALATVLFRGVLATGCPVTSARVEAAVPGGAPVEISSGVGFGRCSAGTAGRVWRGAAGTANSGAGPAAEVPAAFRMAAGSRG